MTNKRGASGKWGPRGPNMMTCCVRWWSMSNCQEKGNLFMHSHTGVMTEEMTRGKKRGKPRCPRGQVSFHSPITPFCIFPRNSRENIFSLSWYFAQNTLFVHTTHYSAIPSSLSTCAGTSHRLPPPSSLKTYAHGHPWTTGRDSLSPLDRMFEVLLSCKLHQNPH